MERPDRDRWRVLAESQPTLDTAQASAVADALRRQHEDPEEHDRSLIVERLAWSPERRLREHQAWLDLIASRRAERA